VAYASAAYAGALVQVEAGEPCQLPHCHQAAAAEALTALKVQHTQRSQATDVRKTCSFKSSSDVLCCWLVIRNRCCQATDVRKTCRVRLKGS
jgi:hypothetical protein